MNDWLKQHAWPIIIALIGIGTTFILYGYRIDTLEKEVAANSASITAINTQQTGIQVQLAKMATDIEYIKQSIDRLSNQK